MSESQDIRSQVVKSVMDVLVWHYGEMVKNPDRAESLLVDALQYAAQEVGCTYGEARQQFGLVDMEEPPHSLNPVNQHAILFLQAAKTGHIPY